MYRILFIVITVLAVALGLLVGTLNSDTVSVDLLWLQIDWPLGLLLLTACFAGLLLGLLLSWLLSILPLKAQLRKVRGADNRNSTGSLNNPHA